MSDSNVDRALRTFFRASAKGDEAVAAEAGRIQLSCANCTNSFSFGDGSKYHVKLEKASGTLVSVCPGCGSELGRFTPSPMDKLMAFRS